MAALGRKAGCGTQTPRCSVASWLMRILVTRPAEEGERFAKLLRARGHEPILSRAIDIQFEDGPGLSLEGAQAILVTSANGVRALVRRTKKRNVPLFVVGPQTAEAAHMAGFVSVRDAKGDSNFSRKVSANGPLQTGDISFASPETR